MGDLTGLNEEIADDLRSQAKELDKLLDKVAESLDYRATVLRNLADDLTHNETGEK
jgi:hypothetical protein